MPVESTGTTLTVAFMVEGRVEDGSLVFQSPYPISKETVDYAVLDGKFPQLSLKEERLSSAVTIWLDDQILPLDPIWSVVAFNISDGKPVINYNYTFDLSGVDENGVNDFDRLIYLPRAKELRVVFNNSYRTTIQPDFITGLLLQRWNEE